MSTYTWDATIFHKSRFLWIYMSIILFRNSRSQPLHTSHHFCMPRFIQYKHRLNIKKTIPAITCLPLRQEELVKRVESHPGPISGDQHSFTGGARESR